MDTEISIRIYAVENLRDPYLIISLFDYHLLINDTKTYVLPAVNDVDDGDYGIIESVDLLTCNGVSTYNSTNQTIVMKTSSLTPS